jgi:formyltetrahydrofolate deformylase
MAEAAEGHHTLHIVTEIAHLSLACGVREIRFLEMRRTAVLLFSSPVALARKGVSAAIAQLLIAHQGSVLHSDDHVDSGRDLFLSRVEWALDDFDIPITDFEEHFKPVVDQFQIKYHLALSDYRPKVAILVSAYDHCLADLLYRYGSGELGCELVWIISNHAKVGPLANFYGVPFHLLTNPRDKQASELEMLELLGQDVDLIVLARYMQILSPDFVGQYLLRIINIHHSFLPAFVGAKPYHQAFERGVKLIGATSHYVTAVLDDGPIIEQDLVRVSHRDTVDDMMRKGRDLERVVLSRAVRWHLENRILVYQNKTVVFA